MLFVSAVNFSQTKLEDVKVEGVKKGIRKSLTTTTNTSVVGSKELLKAACCNLAESFETNPSIDVNFADALTGTKHAARATYRSRPQHLRLREHRPRQAKRFPGV